MSIRIASSCTVVGYIRHRWRRDLWMTPAGNFPTSRGVDPIDCRSVPVRRYGFGPNQGNASSFRGSCTTIGNSPPTGRLPRRLVTDRLGSYRAAHRVIMPSVVHDTTRDANNRAEVSHQRTRQRERHMRRFKSVAQAQRFLAVHDAVRNLFTIGRHQLRAGHQRLLRSRAFVAWNTAAAA